MFADVSARFTPAQLRSMHEHIGQVEANVNARLRDGSVGAAWVAGYFRLPSSLPILRERLLADRYFYGWEGPDLNQESSYLLDDQYPHHLAYIAAIEAITGKPLAEAVTLTPEETAALTTEAAVDFARRDDEPEKVQHGLCVRWLLGKLKPTDSEGTLTDADARRWIARLRAVAVGDWTVRRHGNDLIVERNKPVKWDVASMNANDPEHETRDPDTMPVGPYRLILRFGPRLSVEDYDRLAAENAERRKAFERLRLTVNDIPHKFDDYLPRNDDERRRMAAYEEGVDELAPWIVLPDLYAPDHAVTLFHAGPEFAAVYGGDRAECDFVRASVLRLFGSYDPANATYSGYDGRPEPATRPVAP